MKRFALSVFVITVAMASPAYAQGKKIVTINPDGSVTVTDPQGGDAQQLPAPKVNPSRQPPFIDALPQEEQQKIREQKLEPEKKKTEAPVKPKAPKQAKAPAKKKDPAPSAPAIEKPVAEKPLREKIITPDEPSVEAPDVSAPVVKDVPRPAKKEKQKPEARKDEGPREPADPDSMGRVDPRAKPQAREARPVTPEEAKRIALDIGPPARAVDVFPADYNGRKVFQVVFTTEEGERYVLVDRQTGEIVND